MNRRTDYITAEKVLQVLRIRAENGLDAAVRYAAYIHLPAKLAADIFSRPKDEVRADVPWVDVTCGRRRGDRLNN
jgi:hypothetical protein